MAVTPTGLARKRLHQSPEFRLGLCHQAALLLSEITMSHLCLSRRRLLRRMHAAMPLATLAFAAWAQPLPWRMVTTAH
jgi:hypothetical protein